jgi:hypothetical protein
MAKLPCIHCGKEINAMFGSNTVYFPSDGKTYARCNAGCGRPEGAFDTTYHWERIKAMSEEERQRHRVPDSES